MANWCTNRLTVPKAALDLMIKENDNGSFYMDFGSILPIPQELQDLEFGNEKSDDEAKQKLVDKYGASSSYDYCWSKWGTKWDGWDAHRISDNVVEFFSAWSPPEGVINAISKRFPTFTLNNIAQDEGGSFFDETNYLDGAESHVRDYEFATYNEETEEYEGGDYPYEKL